MQEALVLLKQRSTRSGTASVCLGDSHISVTHDPDSDTPVRHKQTNLITTDYLKLNKETEVRTECIFSTNSSKLNSCKTTILGKINSRCILHGKITQPNTKTHYMVKPKQVGSYAVLYLTGVKCGGLMTSRGE